MINIENIKTVEKPRTYVKRGFWQDYDNCYNAAKQCSSLSEFLEKYQVAYKSAKKNGWCKDYKWFINGRIKAGKTRAKWTQENCLNAARECESTSEFWKKYPGAYVAARKNKWLEDYTWFIPNRIKWTRRSCRKVAKECTTATEFSKKYQGAYSTARKNGWLKDYTWFKNGRKIAAEQRIKWTQENCYEAAKKCKTATSFEKKYPGAYVASKNNDWLKNYTWFIKTENKWSQEICYDIAKKCKTAEEFRKKYNRAYTIAKYYNWIDQYTWLDKKRKQWTEDKCLDVAKTCKTMSELRINYYRAYVTAKNYGWINNYTWLTTGR